MLKDWECKDCLKPQQSERRPTSRLCYDCLCKRHGTTGKCEVCDEPIPRKLVYRSVKKVRRFCSEECRAKGQSLENHPSWGGGRIVNAAGYVRVRVKPGESILEHRLVMEQHLGRPLGQHETVHHKNGNRQDNRIENLELWRGRHGPHQRYEDVVQDFIRRTTELNPHLVAIHDEDLQRSPLITFQCPATLAQIVIEV